MNKQDILAFLSTHKAELKNRFGVLRIGLFGSYARDEQRPDSDVDIAVEIQSDNTFRSFFGLKAYLEDNLHTTVDLALSSPLQGPPSSRTSFMPKRNVALYIDDILDSISAIQSFTTGLSFESFAEDRKTYSATIREYIVIGEAIVALKEPLESRFPAYSWRMIKDFRNFYRPRIFWH